MKQALLVGALLCSGAAAIQLIAGVVSALMKRNPKKWFKRFGFSLLLMVVLALLGIMPEIISISLAYRFTLQDVFILGMTMCAVIGHFIFIIALVSIPLKRNPKKWFKRFGISVLLMVALGFMTGIYEVINPSLPRSSSSIASLNESANTQDIDAAESEEAYSAELAEVLQQTGLTSDEARELSQTFLDMGIYSLSDLEASYGDGIDTLKSFVAVANNNKDLRFYFTFENRVMFYVGFRNEDLYDIEQGGVLKRIEDVDIS